MAIRIINIISQICIRAFSVLKLYNFVLSFVADVKMDKSLTIGRINGEFENTIYLLYSILGDQPQKFCAIHSSTAANFMYFSKHWDCWSRDNINFHFDVLFNWQNTNSFCFEIYHYDIWSSRFWIVKVFRFSKILGILYTNVI